MSELNIIFYSLKGCTLCKSARDVIGRVKADIPFVCTEIDISTCADLLRRFSDNVPTVFINGKKAFKFKVDEGEFRKRVRKEIIKAGISRAMNKKEQGGTVPVD